MFTGIVQAVGRIASAVPRGDGLRLAVDPGALAAGDVASATASRSAAAA